MLNKLLTGIFGSRNDRLVTQLRKKVEKINALETQFQSLDDDALRGKTAEFRERLEKGETLDQLLPEAFATMRDNKQEFDLVYIDGAHDYSSVTQDLRATMPLVQIGGIIAGDDLEVSIEEIDINFANTHRERDFVTDPLTTRKFHPGVVLGVNTVLGKPRIYTGFWAFRRIDIERWEPVEIATASLPPIPPHLLEFS